MKRLPILILIGLLALGLAYGQRLMGQQNSSNNAPPCGYAITFAGILHDEAAALLGIAPEELAALHREGKTLAEIAEQRDVDLTEFAAQLTNARNAAIDQAVLDGILSEAQADFMKSRTETMISALLEREAGARSRSAQGRHMAMHAGWGFGPAGMGSCPNCPHHLGPHWNH